MPRKPEYPGERREPRNVFSFPSIFGKVVGTLLKDYSIYFSSKTFEKKKIECAIRLCIYCTIVKFQNAEINYRVWRIPQVTEQCSHSHRNQNSSIINFKIFVKTSPPLKTRQDNGKTRATPPNNNAEENLAICNSNWRVSRHHGGDALAAAVETRSSYIVRENLQDPYCSATDVSTLSLGKLNNQLSVQREGMKSEAYLTTPSRPSPFSGTSRALDQTNISWS